MRVAIHQYNFIPWFPFFYKMAMVDKFILLGNVQFEKNGFQNRYQLSNGTWVTKPVQHGLSSLKDKRYASLRPLEDLNSMWINAIKDTLEIETEVSYDVFDEEFETPTHRLIKEIKNVGGDVYVTNPSAKDKYLDENLMRSNGIEIEYCKVPKNLNIHIFEAFEKFGIEGTIKQLPKCKESLCVI